MWLDVSSFFLLRDPKRNSQNIFCTKVDWWGICGERDTKVRVSGCLEGEGVRRRRNDETQQSAVVVQIIKNIVANMTPGCYHRTGNGL